MIKISTAVSSNFGHEVIFGSLTLKFDKLGNAEVADQKIADQLTTNYAGWLFQGEVTMKKGNKAVDVNNTQIQADLERALEKVESRESVISSLENEVKEWKEQVNLYKDKSEKAEAELEGYKIQSDKIIKELELKVGLTSKTQKELVEFCIRLEIPEERYKNLTNKAEIINVILDESRIKE